MMNSIGTLAWRFSAHRMVADYVRAAYLPAVGGVSCQMRSRRDAIMVGRQGLESRL